MFRTTAKVESRNIARFGTMEPSRIDIHARNGVWELEYFFSGIDALERLSRWDGRGALDLVKVSEAVGRAGGFTS